MVLTQFSGYISRFQFPACQEFVVKVGVGEENLPAQLSEEFTGGSLQVTSPAALLQSGDPFGRKISGDASKRVPRNVGKPL